MTPKRLSETRLKEIRNLLDIRAAHNSYTVGRPLTEEILADRDAILEIAVKALKEVQTQADDDNDAAIRIANICDIAAAALKELAQGD